MALLRFQRMVRLGAMVPLTLLLVITATGCGGSDGEEETTAEGEEGTSGGEGTSAEMERPPGSVQPGDPGWDADESGGTSSEAGTTTGGEAAGPAESPWGSTVAETGRPLPPRRPMNGSARSSYRQGLEAAQRGNSEAAESAFEQTLAADPNAYKAAYNLGVIADRGGSEGRALEYYQRALRIQADYEGAAAGIIAIHIRRGNVPDAVAFIEPLARQWERNLHLQSLYAEVLVQANRADDALTAARRALRRDERFVPAMIAIVKASLKQGRNELADAVLVQALAVQEDNAELHYLKARMLLDEEGRLREALESLRRAVTLRPDYAEARMALGIQLLSGANYTEALAHFEAAERLAPRLVEVHLNLGDAYRANKQWQKAKQSFDRALLMRSNLPHAHFNLALMYMAAGAEFPGMDKLASLRKAIEEFTSYRNMMGPRLTRDDPVHSYLEDLGREAEREERRVERDRARAQSAAERAARQAAEGGSSEGEEGGGE